MPLLQCVLCGEVPPIKSNQGIADEVQRLIAHTLGEEPLSCPNAACAHHGVPVGTKKAYRAFGKTASGAQRYRCMACMKTVSRPKPSSGQRETYHNLDIFKMLVNKVPLSRIVEMLGISWTLLYHRIDYIHAQCMRFAGQRERKLAQMPLERLNVAIDRQDHVINWTERKDKRNVVLSAITSVDNASDTRSKNPSASTYANPRRRRDAMRHQAARCSGDAPSRRHSRSNADCSG